MVAALMAVMIIVTMTFMTMPLMTAVIMTIMVAVFLVGLGRAVGCRAIIASFKKKIQPEGKKDGQCAA